MKTENENANQAHPNLSIFFPKSLCKDRIINYLKYGDVCRDKTKSLYP